MIIGTQTQEAVVYKITNLISGRYYIGVSVRFEQRIKEHTRNPNKKIQADMDKSNFSFEDNFDKEIIFQGTEEECYDKEIELIAKEKPFYNTAEGGVFGNHVCSLSGENNGSAKFTNKEVENMRKESQSGINDKILASKYKTSHGNIAKIIRGISYTAAGGPIRETLGSIGENNGGGGLLKEKDILDIRKRIQEGEKSIDVANLYNTSQGYIRSIVTNKIWKSVGGPTQKVKEYNSIGSNNPKAKLKEEDIPIIYDLVVNKNKTGVEVGKMFGVNKSTISSIITGKTWKNVKRDIQKPKTKNGTTYTDSFVKEVRIYGYKTKTTYLNIANKFGVHKDTAERWIMGKTRISAGGPMIPKDYNILGEYAL